MRTNANEPDLIARTDQIVQFQLKRVVVPTKKAGNKWLELARDQIPVPIESCKGPFGFGALWKNLSCALTQFARSQAESAFNMLVFHRLVFDHELGEISMEILSGDGKQCAIGILMYKVI